VIENFTTDAWDRQDAAGAARPASNPMSDTALRRVKAGTVLRYGYEIYNARLDHAKIPAVEVRIRIFKDGKLVLEGKQTKLNVTGQTDLQRLKAAGAISIGDQMLPGDYILQVIVTDPLAIRGQQVATQVVQFEIIG
jgi:hypothetical protein